MHSHADLTLPVVPTADSLVHQGVTSVVAGQCGLTFVPLLAETREQVQASANTGDLELPWDEWSTFGSYVDYIERIGISVNMAMLVGQGAVRAAIIGFAGGPATTGQMARMQAEVARAMDSGAIGISTGLIYPPGSFADTEELVDVTRPVGERGGFYFSHIRGEDHRLLEAIAEAIHIGRETGAAVQISHFKASGRQNWPLATQGMEMIDRARAEGLDVAMDMYPYTAGATGLAALLPEWAQEGGKEATLRRLADPDTRRAMITSMQTSGFFQFAEWDEVFISGAPRRREYQGHSVAELAEASAKDPFDWVFDALMETALGIDMIVFQVAEDNLRMQLRHPAMMIGTDADAVAPTGPLSKGLPHPRHYGTYPRVLARYVREESLLSLEEAIWKMSGLAAQRLRWTERGLVKKGYRADLVVLDPDIVADRATYEKPHQYPVGVSHVIVNGQVVVDHGIHTQARPGKVLGRP
jgi:N-acyl-D-amino-acid deacylase